MKVDSVGTTVNSLLNHGVNILKAHDDGGADRPEGHGKGVENQAENGSRGAARAAGVPNPAAPSIKAVNIQPMMIA